MGQRWIAITGGDAAYFSLIEGCVRSIRDKKQGEQVALGILDCGLTDAQRAWLRGQGATLVEPGWDFDFAGRDKLAGGYKALTARPFLPSYFPGYDTYLWIDGDCWVQQWDAVELFLQGAQKRDLAVAPEIHRAFRHYRHAWKEFSTVNGAAYAAAFGQATADKLVRYPLVNAGVFAMRAESPAWKVWADTLAEALGRSTDMVDQIALNVAVYERGLREEALPSTCNWAVHHALPAWDTARQLFVAPSLPHEPLGILHLTIYTKRVASFEIEQLGGPDDGKKRWMSLHYVPPGQERWRAATPGGFNP